MKQLSLFDYSRLIQPTPNPKPSRNQDEKENQKQRLTNYQARIFYNVPQIPGDPEERRQRNEKALKSSTLDFVYQNYSGIGGLHGIEFKDFGNFHDYTKAKQEFEMGQFFTPSETARLIIEILEIEPKKKVADLGCGMGQFFNYLKDCEFCGIEVDDDAHEVATTLYPKASIEYGDMRYMTSIPLQDYIVGNPPFNLIWDSSVHPLRSAADKILSQDYYVHKCHEFLKPGGFFAFICPATWLNDELRCGKIRSFLDENFTQIFEISLPSTLFQNVGVKNFPTKILGFQKKIPEEFNYNSLSIEYGNALNDWRSSETYRQFLENKHVAFKHQAEIKYENYFVKKREVDGEKKSERWYRKLLYEVKRQNSDFAKKAEKKKKEIENAKKPDNMDWDVWVEKRPTLEKLITGMKRWLGKKAPCDLIRLVKNQSQIRLKGYSYAAKAALKQLGIQTEWCRNKLINKEYWKEEWASFQDSLKKIVAQSIFYSTKGKCTSIRFQNFSAQSYFRKKHREFRNLRSILSEIEVQPDDRETLEGLQLGDKKLLPHQVEDIGKALQKQSALLNWEMGTGKTLSAIAWSKLKTGRTLVVAPSLLIRKTWQEELKSSGEENYLALEKMSDIEYGRNADFVLISLERLPNYYKRLRIGLRI